MRTTLSFLAFLALATPGLAQDTPAEPEADETTAEEAPAEPGGLSMGVAVAPDGNPLGSPYVSEEHGDWDIRCIRTEEPGNDPCQLYQLLNGEDGNPVAEFALFPLPTPQGEAIAGGTIITPLETMLTQAVTLTIDGANARRYPFTFCNQTGCFARVGFSQADIDSFKRGATAAISIVPVVAPDQRINLTVSLAGFTAGYDALLALNPPAQE